MTKKLLHKTFVTYLTYAVLVLLVSAPLFYFSTKQLYIEDADEALLLHKNEFLQFKLTNLKQSDIAVWNKFNRDILIKEPQLCTKDSFFYTYYYDSLAKENEPYRELNTPIIIEGKPYTYAAKINLVETEDLIKNIAILFLIIICLLLVGLLFIYKKSSENIWKPFYETLQQIENFEIDQTNLPQFKNSNIEEFNRLNYSLQNLIQRNISIYKSQKEFIENAAHELQTPLAIFQAKIDSLLQTGDFTATQYQIINTLNQTIARLNRLNKNLLLLSSIENGKLYVEKKTLNIKNIIEKQFNFFEEQANAKKITIQKELLDNVNCIANLALLEILINNLLMNAIKHNIVNGSIHIQLNQQSLCITNTGKPAPLNLNKLFIRFAKSNPSEQGTGLGLAISKKIADINGWSLIYKFTNHNIHTFCLHLK